MFLQGRRSRTSGRSNAFRGLVLLAVLTMSAGPTVAQSRDRFRDLRLRMVREYIEREGIANPRVLASMKQVPRHEFVRSGLRKQVYFDGALPIGYKQTISPPFIVAYMTESIDPQPTDRVLEIGTGSGYQTAVLSGLVKEIYTIEIVEPLGKTAAKRLKRLGYDNVHAKVGDGFKGWAEHAPFDKIIVTCSPENVPAPLVEQLREGGRMIIPLGERYQQVFHLLEKRNRKLVQKKLIPTLFVPMTGIAEDNRKVKPDPLNPRIVNGGFEVDSNRDQRPDNWHYLRQATLVKSDAPEGDNYLRFDNDGLGRPAQLLQGLPVDGRKIRTLRISVRVKVDKVTPGFKSYEKPALTIHFFDSVRRTIAEAHLGPWLRRSDWQRAASSIPVPVKAREAIVRIGLNGAIGRLSVDDVRLVPKRR